MSSRCSCTGGQTLFNHCVNPALSIRDYFLADRFTNHPLMGRLIGCAVAVPAGLIDVFLFPIISSVTAVALPFIALGKYIQFRKTANQERKKEAVDCLKAWAFSLISVVGCATFIALFGFKIPAIGSVVLIATAFAISIIVHIYQFCEPPPDRPTSSDKPAA